MTTTTRRNDERLARSMLEELFERLRDAGFGTIEGRICCSNCATHDDRVTGGDGPGAYYTEQDVEGGFGDGVCIGYCVDRDAPDGAAMRAGATVAWIADDVGFDVDWNGETCRKVCIELP